MSQVSLPGLKVNLGDPTLVAEAVGHCWFPGMGQFPTGEVIVSVSIVADAHGLQIRAQRIYVSEDDGQTWEYRYTVSEAPAGVKIPRPDDGDMLMVPGRMDPDPPGQWRSFAGPYARYQEGGRRIVIENKGARMEGLPRDIKATDPKSVPAGTVNQGAHSFGGRNCGALEVDGQLLVTNYLEFDGDDLYSTVLLGSSDEGRTWRYISTVAGPEAVPPHPSMAPGVVTQSTPHGPCEPSMVQLETGELMCVMRVGSGPDWNLARTYSDDGGRTWSECDYLPAWSVEPSLRRLSNGTLALSTGRPGIYLWLSKDPRGESWEQIDIIERHNASAPPEQQIRAEKSGSQKERHATAQTTAYTELVEIAPNKLLLVYDRTPFAWNPVPLDSEERSRVYVMPIEVQIG